MIFSSIDEIKQHHPALITLDFEELENFIRQVEEDEIIPLIGDELYNELIDSVDDSSAPESLVKLLVKVRDVLAPLIFYNYIPFMNGKQGQSGIMVVENDNERQAPRWMIEKMQTEAHNKAMKAAERLLSFLEKNADDYESWTSSDVYTEYKDGFIINATEFDKYVNINKSRRIFLALKTSIKRIEEWKIKPVLGDDLFDEIKQEIAENDISTNNIKLLNFIKQAVASLSISEGITELAITIDEKGVTLYEHTGTADDPKRVPAELQRINNYSTKKEYSGNTYLKQLEEFLIKNKTDYPLYNAGDADGEPFRNSETSNTAGFLY
jgi:hypothetical protein